MFEHARNALRRFASRLLAPSTWFRGAGPAAPAGAGLPPQERFTPAATADTSVLRYFDETLAVEREAINDRRKKLASAERPFRPIARLRGEGDAWPPPPGPVVPGRLDAKRMRPVPLPCSAVGVALSGGGIRSAAVCLGALQALDCHDVIARADYLSTVSGGGYIGACMTARMSRVAPGVFPFGRADAGADVRDNEVVGYIRNFSNYLLPRSRSSIVNLLDVTAVLLRGLLANIIIVLNIMIGAALLTYACYPDWNELPTGNFILRLVAVALPRGFAYSASLWAHCVDPFLPVFHLGWLSAAATAPGVIATRAWLADIHRFLLSLLATPFLTTEALTALGALALIGWAVVRSDQAHTDNDANSPDIVKARWCLGVVVVSAVLDLQPLCVYGLGKFIASPYSFSAYFSSPLLLGAVVVALYARRLGAFLATTRISSRPLVTVLRIVTQITLMAAGLVLPFALFVVYWFLTVWLYPNSPIASQIDAPMPHWIYVAGFAVATVLTLVFSANAYSLHQFYKDRLTRAFLFEPDQNDESAQTAMRDFKLSSIDSDECPYHIINAALNVQGSLEANRRGRNADFFTFTKHFVGSDLTHFAPTRSAVAGDLGMERVDPRLNVGSAIAISGAALSANMGSSTVRWLSPTLALLNIRLGYWLRNPRSLPAVKAPGEGKPGLLKYLSKLFGRNFPLLPEILNMIDEQSDSIFLSDGGHIENLGIYQLLKRGCRLIIAIDAEADPDVSCASLLKLERYARIDLGIRIVLPWEQIARRNAEIHNDIDPRTPQRAHRHHGQHCALGPIIYEDNSRGMLLYFKSSLSGDEKDYVLDYKKRHRDFPHETTGDQFFSEEQFEVYRSLGYHIVDGYFSNTDQISWQRDGRHGWPSLAAAKAEVLEALGYEREAAELLRTAAAASANPPEDAWD